MGNGDFIHEPDDREIDIMLKYVPEYSENNARNIKNKFVQKAKSRHKKFSLKKLTLVTLAASMVLITTLVYAEVLDIGKIYRIIFGENSEYVEQYIEPLVGANEEAPVHETRDEDKNESLVENEASLSIRSEHDGIVIKLISAINDENVLRIFATLTDTTGDRLGQQMDFTSWGLSQGYGGGVSVIDYNNGTKTATLLITSLGSDHQGGATLAVDGISTGRELLEGLPENNIDINALLENHTPNIISQSELIEQGGYYNAHEVERMQREDTRLLKFDETDIKFDNSDMFSISNVGFVDGRLHIQVKAVLTDVARVDGYYIALDFVDAEKEVVHSGAAGLNLLADRKYAYGAYREQAPYIVEYREFIYDGITSPEQLNDLSMTMTYMKSPKIIEGHWEFSFVVPEKVTTEFHVDREFHINGDKLRIDKVSLSPLGITVHLPKNMSADYKHSDAVYVEYGNGAVIELDQSAIHTYEGESTLIFGGRIIKIEDVQDIIINGEKINISQ